MAKFIKVPEAESAEASMVERIDETLLSYGIETGMLGGLLLMLSAVCALTAAFQLYRLIARGVVANYAEGEVVDLQPAPGGGLNPIVRYTDRSGRGRQFVGQFHARENDVGRRMRLRVDGERPQVAPPPPNPARQAAFLVLPIVIGAVCVTAAVMGEIPGVVTLPRL